MVLCVMKPEESARKRIDELLELAGWKLQDYKDLNLGAGLGVAVREYPLKSGFADYMLFVERHAVGVVEAKPEGTTLSGVSDQTEKYLHNFPENVPHLGDVLPFAYESTGVETYFRDLRDPDCRSRRVFAFHKPDTLHEWVHEEDTLRGRLRKMPPLKKEGLRDCQIDAIENLEWSLKEARPRALIQMASGSGKTYTAVTEAYRLIKYAGARRVLFLVDRNNLGKQTLREFQNYATPDDGRKFTEIYNVQRLTSKNIDDVSRVCITTIQRLYAILLNQDYAEENEEASAFETVSEDVKPVEVEYYPRVPVEKFDFIITDECHRSIYNLWRQVLEYFDAFMIGLTATPSKQTLGFFNQNLVMEYGHDRAVADGVNVPYEVYRIQTKITKAGSKVDAGYYIDRRDRLTRKLRWEKLDTPLEYEARELDRSVVAKDQIRLVVQTFRDRLFTDIFPGRTQVPKTLIFAKDDSHAEDVVEIVREEFGKGNDFCKKITYRTQENPDSLIKSFANSYDPRIAVTVDMISTGTDIRALECLLFMRDVHSNVYFEQMKGRGTRTITDTDLIGVSSDAKHKTHFIIVDAVGVCESDKTDSRPLERKRSVPFKTLLNSVAQGVHDSDTLSSLAGRLASFNKEIDSTQRAEIEATIPGKTLRQVINEVLDAVDPDKHLEKAKQLFRTDAPTPEQVKQAAKEMGKQACTLFDDPKFRNKVLEIKQRNEQTIDNVSKDALVYAGLDIQAKVQLANAQIKSFQDFIDANKDELTALQILYSKPYNLRQLTFEEVKQLAEAIEKPPYNLTPELLWLAYQQLEKSKVKGAGPQKLLTNIVSLVRFAIGYANVLEPFPEEVNRNFKAWLNKQEASGNHFTPEQQEWLNMIKQHITTSLNINLDAFELAPFNQKGGAVKAYKLFGQQLNNIIDELNTVLTQ
jgi:type I restriction enzyme R subunit